MSKPEECFVDCFDTAIGDMLNYYSGKGMGEWIWPHIEFCARRGLVHMTPDVCLLARPVDIRIDIDVLNSMGDVTTGPDELLFDTYLHGAWHILYASGELQDFFPLCPYELPWLLWQRNGGKARAYQFDRVKRMIMK